MLEYSYSGKLSFLAIEIDISILIAFLVFAAEQLNLLEYRK